MRLELVLVAFFVIGYHVLAILFAVLVLRGRNALVVRILLVQADPPVSRRPESQKFSDAASALPACCCKQCVVRVVAWGSERGRGVHMG